jgi:transcription elongation factor Elf1
MDADRPVTSQDTRTAALAPHFHCPRCHRVTSHLTEYAELLADGEIRHVACDRCVAELRDDPIVVVDFVRELAS